MTVPRRVHRLVGRVVRPVALAAFLALAPSRVAPWRLDRRFAPVAMLVVGEPTPSLRAGPGRAARGGVRGFAEPPDGL